MQELKYESLFQIFNNFPDSKKSIKAKIQIIFLNYVYKFYHFNSLSKSIFRVFIIKKKFPCNLIGHEIVIVDNMNQFD